MNIFLIECFKKHCDARVKSLLDSCYLICRNEQFHELEVYGKLNLTICYIYAPCHIAKQLETSEKTLIRIGDALHIDLVEIVPISLDNLAHFRKVAVITNNLEKWRKYLELQYLF
ncbi:MAG: hypothetical protein ACFBSE_18250 [Prochloraceae cyanobacterium]